MKIPIKQHQLISHSIPGLVVLMVIVMSHFKWNYVDFSKIVSNQGSVATLSIILLAIAAFLIGEFLDSVRDLFEWGWDKISKHKIIWDHLFTADSDMANKRDSYWTYYVLNFRT